MSLLEEKNPDSNPKKFHLFELPLDEKRVKYLKWESA